MAAAPAPPTPTTPAFTAALASLAPDEASVLERELHCSICTDLLLDPVTFLNCLHTTCGACAKRWFVHQAAQSSHSPTSLAPTPSLALSPTHPPAYTCPVCRKRVRQTRSNPIVVSLLEDFERRWPEKAQRCAEEVRAKREVWKPGEPVLPWRAEEGREERMAPLDGVLMQRAGGREVETAQELQRATSPIRDAGEQVFQGPRRGSVPALPLPPSPQPTRTRHSVSPRPSHTHTPSLNRHLSAPIPPVRTPSAPPPPPTSLLTLLQHSSQTRPILTCDICHARLDTSVHLECGTCTLFHLCTRCHRSGRTCPHSHPLHRQKLTPAWPRPQLAVGIFCDVCDAWCDEDRNGATKSAAMFWHCRTCNDGRWTYCMRCVARSWTCTHELTLWSNSRHTPSPPSTRRGGAPAPHLPALPPETLLLALGYAPWTWATDEGPNSNSGPGFGGRICTLCTLPIAPTSSYTHCFAPHCCGGPVCTTCYYNRFRTFPSAARAAHSLLRCPASGIAMALLAHPGRAVLHRGVFAHGVRPRRPEWIAAGAGGLGGVGGTGVLRGAVGEAVRAHWPEEVVLADGGGRAWGRGQWLCFPKGAEVLDVVTAFEVEGERWCWGSYAGVGGLFPGACVRLCE
ncbi:hypothetical protein EDC01DRAFT_644216 [Geopyxis carbonaria]|nr:hypothetical protein EDC01DRAFT_644216 [Geopyxis carbonaria]